MSNATSGTVTMEALKGAADETMQKVDQTTEENTQKSDDKGDVPTETPIESASNDDTVTDEGNTELSELEKRISAEKELQAVKSNLGRKLAALELKLDQVVPSQVPQASESNDEEDDFEIPTSREEFMAAFEEAKAKDALKASTKQAEYERKYLDTVNGMNAEDLVLHQEIYDEMMKNHNVKNSPDPVMDAQLNYAKAQISVLNTKVNNKTNPLSGNKSDMHNGTVEPQKMINRQKAKEYSLTAEEKEFASEMGMTNEQIVSALDTPVKPGQGRI